MLVLTRRTEERIDYFMPDGSRAELTLLGIRGEQARLGLDAPSHIRILRGELWDAMSEAQQQEWLKPFLYPRWLCWVIRSTLALQHKIHRRAPPARTKEANASDAEA